MKRKIKIKILFPVICLIIALITGVTPAYAVEINGNFYDNDSAAEDLAQDMEIILETANDMLSGLEYGTVTADDLDYEKAVKIYIDEDILADENLDSEKIREYAERAEYIYYFPIFYGDETVMLTVSKGCEVTDSAREILSASDISRLEGLVGRWYVAQVQIYDAKADYIENVVNTLNPDYYQTGAEVYYFGGLTSVTPIVAAVCFQRGVMFKIIEIENGKIEIEDENSASYGGSTDGTDTTSANGVPRCGGGEYDLDIYNDLLYESQLLNIATDEKQKDGQYGSAGYIHTADGNSDKALTAAALSVTLILALTIIAYGIYKIELRNKEKLQ